VTSTPAKKRPTINDVARVAGVSRGTVSRVLTGGHWVSPDASAAVTAAIAETGYRVNPHARSLATSKANSVAFLLTESYERLFDDPNFAILLRGAATALAQSDIPLVLLMAGNEAEQRRATEFITGGHVDGVLLVSSHQGKQDFLPEISKAGVPAISCGIPLGFERKIGYVAADDFSGAQEMVRYLQEIGRSRIATIAGPQDTSGGVTRLRGYRDELGDAVVEDRIAYGDYGFASGERAMHELLERAPDIDAVFVGNDLMARGAITAIESTGRRVPEDIAVGGFDDSPAALDGSPTITTMRQPFERISQEMVRLLLAAIDGEATAAMTIPTQLVRRESA
jgi:DNA-binding LacI/PurR family transcriptional regulator